MQLSGSTRAVGTSPLSALAAAVLVVTATASIAQQNAPTNWVASEDIVLGTKTPLGEANIAIPAGTALTNCEVQGGKARVWQGPFSATVDAGAVQPDAPSATPTPDSTPSADATPDAAVTPSPAPTAEAPVPEASATPSRLEDLASALPGWAVPAAGGALVAYALFATVALLRPRRPERTHSPETKAAEPIIVIPPKPEAKPAVIADGGRAIACPLCGKHIPLEKLGKGRNRCPSCAGTFVGE